MSETPRTDDAIAAMREINADPFFVEASFCKRIERELTEANARLSKLEKTDGRNPNADLDVTFPELRHAAGIGHDEMLVPWINRIKEKASKLELELAEANEKIQRVEAMAGKAMDSIRGFPCGHKPNAVGGSRKACEALKEWDQYKLKDSQ